MQAKNEEKKKLNQRRPGRPKVSNLSQTELAKHRMRRLRERKRERKNLVPVEVWIPKSQRDILLKTGKDLSAVATEAFALLFRKGKY
jgi:hypothetical protein